MCYSGEEGITFGLLTRTDIMDRCGNDSWHTHYRWHTGHLVFGCGGIIPVILNIDKLLLTDPV